jgi:peptidoglycan/LPS O-acetylase OafA/YrhL
VQEAFDPRNNSIGFLRWFLAFAVIFSHAGPLGGFYHSKNLGTQWSNEQSFGGVAVAGFFFLSGFLITLSRRGSITTARYFWRRILRIFPAFWAALIFTAFVLAPTAWYHVHHTLSGYFSAATESPLTYFRHNMLLSLHQRNIADMGGELPLAKCCGKDWNGSAWTLVYEFKGYIAVGVFGLIGFLAYRWLTLAACAFMISLNVIMFEGIHNDVTKIFDPLTAGLFNVMLLTPFFFGMAFALFADKIPIDYRLALAGGGLAFYTYFIAHGWNEYGQFGFLYLLMWCAVRLPLRNWERPGDMSYGIYIYAWPLQTFAAYYGLQNHGWLVYHLVIALACHVVAFASWHLLEKRALSLKNWTPVRLAVALARIRPVTARARQTVFGSLGVRRPAPAPAAPALIPTPDRGR